MNERDYIVATSLAKVRIVSTVVRSLIPFDLIDDDDIRAVLVVIARWERSLEAAVDSE